MSINLAGSAYKVTVPACVLITTLRLKLKAEQEVKQKAEREANKTKKTWYLAIIFLVGLAILAVFFIKREHQSSNDPNNSPKSGVKKTQKS
ncbi:hypothetical protein YGH009_04150 [Helicobacter pylori]